MSVTQTEALPLQRPMNPAAYTDADITLLYALAAGLVQRRTARPLQTIPSLPSSCWPRSRARDDPYQFRPLGPPCGRYSRGLYLPRPPTSPLKGGCHA